MRAPESPHLNLEEEVRAGEKRRDFEAWMRAKEPKGFRGGTKDFRENVTVIRERAGRMAAEDDRRRLGDDEFQRRVDSRRAKFGGGGVAASEERRDSGIASVGDEVGDEVDEEDVLVVGEEGPKRVSFTMKELERQLSRKGEGVGAWVGRGTPPTRPEMIQFLLSADEKELAEMMRKQEARGERRRDERGPEREESGGGKGKGKGKGKGRSSGREEAAEERHVRRQEEGRSK